VCAERDRIQGVQDTEMSTRSYGSSKYTTKHTVKQVNITF